MHRPEQAVDKSKRRQTCLHIYLGSERTSTTQQPLEHGFTHLEHSMDDKISLPCKASAKSKPNTISSVR